MLLPVPFGMGGGKGTDYRFPSQARKTTPSTECPTAPLPRLTTRLLWTIEWVRKCCDRQGRELLVREYSRVMQCLCARFCCCEWWNFEQLLSWKLLSSPQLIFQFSDHLNGAFTTVLHVKTWIQQKQCRENKEMHDSQMTSSISS